MDSPTINNVIFYLNSKPSYEESAWLQRMGNNGTYVTNFAVIVEELKRLDLLDVKIKDGKENYLLKQSARSAIEILPKEFEQKPYEYFLDIKRRKLEAEASFKWWEAENAKQQYEDYPKVRKEAKIAIIIAALSTIAALVEAALLLKK